MPVAAVHVDHGLRAGSEADFAVVAAAAAGLGASSSTGRVTIEPGANLEARARDARYEALEQARIDAGAAYVLVGHTADDQAETVLLNMLRGSATAGLAAMPERQGTIVRPLLGLRRRDTVEICARLAFAPVVDPMNGDARFRRVWLRREVLPLLEAGAGRDLRGLLARQADVMRDESDLLDGLAHRALAAAGDPPRTDHIAVLEPALRAPRPSSVARWVAAVARHDRRVARRRRRRPPCPRAARRSARVRRRGAARARAVARPRPRAPDAPVEFAPPGLVSVNGVALESWVERAAPVAWPDGRETCVVDADAVGDRAWLRPAAPRRAVQSTRARRYQDRRLGVRSRRPATNRLSWPPARPGASCGSWGTVSTITRASLRAHVASSG